MVEAPAFTPDGRRVATASLDGTVKLWDADTGDELLSLPAPGGEGTALAFSPDGEALYVGGGNGEVRSFRAPAPAGK